MPTVPRLIDEDIQRIRTALDVFLEKSEAATAMITAEGGFVIFHVGETKAFDVTSLGALASNAFTANQAIANIITEPNFNSLYQQGEKFSLLVATIDLYHQLIVIFPSTVSVGAVKYYAVPAVERIAAQLDIARQRSPDEGFDPAMLNLEDASELFRKKDP